MQWRPISAGEACGVEKSQSGSDETNLVVTSQKSYNFCSISDSLISQYWKWDSEYCDGCSNETGLWNPLVWNLILGSQETKHPLIRVRPNGQSGQQHYHSHLQIFDIKIVYLFLTTSLKKDSHCNMSQILYQHHFDKFKQNAWFHVVVFVLRKNVWFFQQRFHFFCWGEKGGEGMWFG